MNKNLLQIFKAFDMMNRCWDGEEGAAGGGEGAGEGDGGKAGENGSEGQGSEGENGEGQNGSKGEGSEGKSHKITDEQWDKYDVPTNVRDDESVIESIEERIKADKIAEEGEGGKEGEGKEGSGEEGKDGEGKEGEGKEPEEGKEKEEFDLKFEQDITIGEMEFKKEDLATTPQKILENISSIHGQLETAKAELKVANDRNDGYDNDPIIKERIARINEGKADVPYDFYTVSKDTAKYLQDNFDIDPEDPDDKAKLDGLYKEMEMDLKDNVEKIVNNRLTINNQAAQSKALDKKGMSNIVGIQAHLDEKVRIKETDLKKLWEMKENHPEWEKFNAKNGLGDVMAALTDTGLKGYKQVSEMDTDTLWAIAATKMKLPLAINTKERDKKIVENAQNKLIDLFKPKRTAKALGSSDGSSKNKAHSILGGSVIDDEKLLDFDYVQTLFDGCKTPEDLTKMQEEIDARLSKIAAKR